MGFKYKWNIESWEKTS